MKTSIIDDSKNKQNQQDSGIASMLTSHMHGRFRSTVKEFENTVLSEGSPLHQLMNIKNYFLNKTQGIEEVSKVFNPAHQRTSFDPKLWKARGVQETQTSQNTESVASLQTKRSLEGTSDLPFQDTIQKASQEYGVPVALINAVIKQESAFDPNATSHAGAQGLMQLMPATAKGYGVEDSYNPEQNIMGGTRFLSDLLKKYKGDIQLSLAAYNAGPGNVAKYGNQIPPFKETQNYVEKVGRYYESNLQKMQGSAEKFAATQPNDPSAS